MQTLTEVLAMGGYGAYVWPAYAVAAAVMAAMLASSLHAKRRCEKGLKQLKPTPDDET